MKRVQKPACYEVITERLEVKSEPDSGNSSDSSIISKCNSII